MTRCHAGATTSRYLVRVPAPLPIEVPLALLGVGGALFVVAAGTALHRARSCDARAARTGTVVGAQRQLAPQSPSDVNGPPIVRYLVDGQEKTHTSSVSSHGAGGRDAVSCSTIGAPRRRVSRRAPTSVVLPAAVPHHRCRRRNDRWRSAGWPCADQEERLERLKGQPASSSNDRGAETKWGRGVRRPALRECAVDLRGCAQRPCRASNRCTTAASASERPAACRARRTRTSA